MHIGTNKEAHHGMFCGSVWHLFTSICEVSVPPLCVSTTAAAYFEVPILILIYYAWQWIHMNFAAICNELNVDSKIQEKSRIGSSGKFNFLLSGFRVPFYRIFINNTQSHHFLNLTEFVFNNDKFIRSK